MRGHPYLVGVGSKIIARVHIGRGIGVDGLARGAEPFQRLADHLKMGRPCALKPVQIEHQRLDAAVLRRRVDRMHDVANADFPHEVGAARQQREGRLFGGLVRSEEHTSELQSLMRISYAVFCLKKKKSKSTTT